MSKKKDQNSNEDVVLTAWQQRNLEFLKKKKEEAAEKERLREKLRIERKAQHVKDDSDKQVTKKSPEIKESSLSPEGDEVQEEANDTAKKVKKQTTKAKSPRRKQVKRALPIFILASVILMVSLFLISPWSKQKTITVSGFKNALERDIISDSGIKGSDYIFNLILNHKNYEKAVETSNVWIKKANLTYQFPNRFTLKVNEYSIVAYTQTDQGYQPILENGKRVDTVNASELPEKFVTINLTDENQIQQLIKSFSSLKEDLLHQIQTVSLANSASTPDLLLVTMQDGNLVRVPLSEFDSKFPYYEKIKGKLQETSIVDMEVGIYTTTAAIEEEVAADKAKAKEKATEEATSSTEGDSQTTTATEDTLTEEATTQESTDSQSTEQSVQE